MSIRKNFPVKKAAVLGAGVMGAQIAAQLANANVQVILYDLPTEEGNSSLVVENAITGLTKLHPSPLASNAALKLIEAANYNDDLEKLSECDLIIEAVAEQLTIKQDLYQKITPFMSASCFFVSNTSGLSITELAAILPENLSKHFCGVHFFNPPRYMHLVELIAHPKTEKYCLEALETFLVSTLGKGVVHAKDTPNFIANRIGVFCYLAILHHAKEYGVPIEIVDQLTGPLIGRAKSATFRTFDVIGLDTLGFVIQTMKDKLTADPWHAYFEIPEVIHQLVEKGYLGQKTKKGFYTKDGDGIKAYNPVTGDYDPLQYQIEPEVLEILKLRDTGEKFTKLYQSKHPQAQFLWASYRDLFHYVAYHLTDVADTTRCIDLAMRWGFGWKQGPFETWQSSGGQLITEQLYKDLSEGKTMVDVPIPEWLHTDSFSSFYTQNGSYSPSNNRYLSRSLLPIYQKQYYPDPVLQESISDGTTVYEDDDVRLWHLKEDIGILSFKSKLGSMGQGVLKGINTAIEHSESRFKGMVIWQRHGNYFSIGANLKEILTLIEHDKLDQIDQFIADFQKTTEHVRTSVIPIVAAVQGFALGGGCELMLHCDQRVFALETYSGLVELGVGLIPAGGGCKEIARLINLQWANSPGSELLMNNFTALLAAQMTTSATQLKPLKFAQAQDHIILNRFELLYAAQQQVQALADASYRPVVDQKIKVLGLKGVDYLTTSLETMFNAGQISEYDLTLGKTVGKIICGGEVAFGESVTLEHLLALERSSFVQLVQQEKTRERIKYMLETGKKLMN